jgi:hypothetical protein
LLNGDLRMPVDSHGIVLFAHGSGSSRHSPRNQYLFEEAGTLERVAELASNWFNRHLQPRRRQGEAPGAGTTVG